MLLLLLAFEDDNNNEDDEANADDADEEDEDNSKRGWHRNAHHKEPALLFSSPRLCKTQTTKAKMRQTWQSYAHAMRKATNDSIQTPAAKRRARQIAGIGGSTPPGVLRKQMK